VVRAAHFIFSQQGKQFPVVCERKMSSAEKAPPDPAALQQKLVGVSMFKIVSETLYPRTQSSMPEQVQVNLYAYHQQATIGPNTESPPNCLLSFFSPPLTNVKWQTWRNLAAMPKAKAMKSFMEIYMDNDPEFLVSCRF